MNIPLITTILKAVTALWSLLVLAISAALIARFNGLLGSRRGGSGFSQGNAVLAASIFDLVYFTVALAFIFLRPESILVSVLVDTIALGFLFLLTLGSVAALSDIAFLFRDCSGDSFCGLGNATLGLGWILVFLILAILLLEIIVTLRGYGGSLDTWRTPFNELVTNGTPTHGGGLSRGVEHRAEGGIAGGTAPMSTVGGAGTGTGAVRA